MSVLCLVSHQVLENSLQHVVKVCQSQSFSLALAAASSFSFSFSAFSRASLASFVSFSSDRALSRDRLRFRSRDRSRDRSFFSRDFSREAPLRRERCLSRLPERSWRLRKNIGKTCYLRHVIDVRIWEKYLETQDCQLKRMSLRFGDSSHMGIIIYGNISTAQGGGGSFQR